MFIRKTHHLNRITKKSYWNYQLVESVRTERGPRQRILLNLGTELELNTQERKELANRIEAILIGRMSLLPVADKIEEYAQRYANQLRDKLATTTEEQPPREETDWQVIDLNAVELQEPRTVGSEHVLLHVINKLEIPSKLKTLGFTKKEVALALGAIIGRAVFPASERATHAWLCKRSGLGELLDFDFQSTRLNQLYQIGDRLLHSKETIESHLERTQERVYGLQSTMVLYDLTNTYIEGRAKKNPKAKHGFSKEKRTDCPLVTLGLVLDEHGFAKRTAFLPGNISEPATLSQAIQHLDRSLIKPIVVLDAGIASDDNLKWLRENHYQYIVSARQKAPSRELAGPLVSVNAETTQVKVALVKTESTEEQWLYCESEAKAAVTAQMKSFFRERLEVELQKLNEGLQKPLGRKRYAKVVERVGRIREKHKAISGCYDIIVEPSEDGTKATAVRWAARPEKLEERLHDHYFLRTNLTNIKPEELWHLYGNLRTVEEAFRFMKSSLGMRPVYHQTEQRVDAHMWITILGYHLIQSCMHELQKQGINEQWETLRNELSTRMRATFQAKSKDNKVIHQRSTTRAEAHQRKIYRALGLSPQILGARKSIV